MFGQEEDDEQKPKAGQTLAERNAAAWRESGYAQWKQGDAQREKELPVGGIAPIRETADQKPYKPMKAKKSFGQTIAERVARK